MKTSKMKGFTLIELIVVIAIIGVLAAILVPSMIGYVGSSKLATANSNAKLAFENTATYCTECEVKGYTVSSGTYSVNLMVAPAGQYSKNGKQLSQALGSLMGNASSGGLAKVKVAAAGVPEDAQWHKSASDLYIGRYPQESDSKAASAAWLT
ncbi:MAG: type II secretion system protein [Oscillospiraceae bacterium]|nr:type II secretion system protein [Oscillospiraceae bacterium]